MFQLFLHAIGYIGLQCALVSSVTASVKFLFSLPRVLFKYGRQVCFIIFKKPK